MICETVGSDVVDAEVLDDADDDDRDRRVDARRTIDELKAASAERDEYLDTLRRLQAEFENYKKRVRQAADRSGRPGRPSRWWTSCCPVLDALDLAGRPPR